MSVKRAGPSSNSTPDLRRSSIVLSTRPITRHKYSRSTRLEGCINALAKSPSVVSSKRPEVVKSSRPTETQRPLFNRGRPSNTVARPSGSFREQTSPTGLWYSKIRLSITSSLETGLPLNLILSLATTRSPNFAFLPLTITSPAVILSSSFLREPYPMRARTF